MKPIAMFQNCDSTTPAAGRLVALFAVALFLAFGVIRAEDPPRVDAVANPAKITVGDLILLTVTVRSPLETPVEFPRSGDSLGPFEVRDFTVDTPRKQNGEWVSAATYTLSIFETGEFMIPSLDIRLPASDGTDAGSVSTAEIPITVESVKPGDAKDILDIKPPLEMARAWWSYWPWLVPLALAALALFLWRRRKKPAAATPAARSAPRLPPYEEAYQALCRLRDSGLLEQQKVKLYHIELSEIIRRYVERRFGIQAMEMTSSEVQAQLQRVVAEGAALRLFEKFLDACDLVKFAKWIPPLERSGATTRTAFEILEATKEETATVSDEGAASPTLGQSTV